MCVCVSMCTLVQTSGVQDPLELELQVVMNFLTGCWQLNSGLLQEQEVLWPTVLLTQGWP